MIAHPHWHYSAVLLIAATASGCASSHHAGPLPTLERAGPAEATVGMISLPLPRERANDLIVDHPSTGAQPVGWWQRDRTPRRVMTFVVGQDSVPETLRLKSGRKRSGPVSKAWSVRYHTTFERLPFAPVPEWEYNALRGFPAGNCTLVEGEVRLTYGGRTVSLQCGATGPNGDSDRPGGVYYWQNVQIDQLWANEVVQSVRVGGIIYNSDTFLWADVYLLLFSNGVAQVSVHFVNTRLAIDGYDFQGLPVIRFSELGQLDEAAHRLPADGLQHQLGPMQLSLSDAAVLFSDEHPGKLVTGRGEATWYPFTRMTKDRAKDAPPTEWMKGEARTVPFTISLSSSVPVVCRYRAPSWWYAECGEFWPWDYLPVRGRLIDIAAGRAAYARRAMQRGRFDAGSGGRAKLDDGGTGEGLMRWYYLTGDPNTFDDALAYCTYWADLMVDHDDHTVHQYLSSPYKTCTYTKFRDILLAWLETGDPYYRDNLEMTAEAYWAWFRSNWPRNTIGRDNFGLSGWALIWKYFDTEHARDRTLELLRMNRAVLEMRGNVGSQMGAGPHPGYHPSLYMTGVALCALTDAAERLIEVGDTAELHTTTQMIRKLQKHYMRDDVEYWTSRLGNPRSGWWQQSRQGWTIKAWRIYSELARIQGREDDITDAGLSKANAPGVSEEGWSGNYRSEERHLYPLWADALMLGARRIGDGVEINPVGSPEHWPEAQTVVTPFGDLNVSVAIQDVRVALTFSCETKFPVTVQWRGIRKTTTSQGTCLLQYNDSE